MCEIDAPTFIPLITAVATLHGLDGPTLSLSDAFALNAEAQKQTTASGIAAVAPITALSRALTAALDPDALAPIAPDFPPERAQEIARAVRNDTVAALCRALDTALRETVGGWDTGAAARALHAAGAFAATLPAADAELDARRGRVLRRLVRVQEDTLSRVAADLTRALADAPPGATFVDELFFAVASATNDALLTNDPAAIAPALAAAEAACAAFSRAAPAAAPGRPLPQRGGAV